MRKPLTGTLTMAIQAVKDVDHAATGRLSRGPETFVIMKVEDAFRVRTKSTRTDKWTDETHTVDIDKANEIELTVYDKSGAHPTPVGMLWIRISDIAEVRLFLISVPQNLRCQGSQDVNFPGATTNPEFFYCINWQC